MSRRGGDDNIIRLRELLPRADSFRIYRCGACQHAHVILVDKNEMPIAEMVIDASNLLTLIVDTAKVLEGGGEMLP
jgi:hypothetical protein